MLWLSQGYIGDCAFYCEEHRSPDMEPLLVQDAKADSPPTCDECGCLVGCLDYNCSSTIPAPLTEYGREYVREMLREYRETGKGNNEFLYDLGQAYPEEKE